MMKITGFLYRLIFIVPILCLLGCSSEPPTDAVTMAETAIHDADRNEAAKYEPLILSAARGKLDKAKQNMQNDDNDVARRLAEEALADARLASAKAEAAKQAEQTDALKKAIQALKQETTRENAVQ